MKAFFVIMVLSLVGGTFMLAFEKCSQDTTKEYAQESGGAGE